jgi:ABC-type antimicrobial peptide transport system permease subunit
MALEEHERVSGVIDLRMKEYETLRSEIIQRIAARQQMAGYAAALTAIAATLGGNLGWWRYLIVTLVLLGSALYLRDSNKGIQRIGLHLQGLEAEINALAAEVYGRPALSWEGRRQGQRDREHWTWKTVGIFGGWHLRKPSKELPGQRTSSNDRTETRLPSQ